MSTKFAFSHDTCMASSLSLPGINMQALMLLMPMQTLCSQQLNFVTVT